MTGVGTKHLANVAMQKAGHDPLQPFGSVSAKYAFWQPARLETRLNLHLQLPKLMVYVAQVEKVAEAR